VISDAGNPTYNLNELEYIDGYIYANQWHSIYLLKLILLAEGGCQADLTDVWNKIQQKDSNADVLNGIPTTQKQKKSISQGRSGLTYTKFNLINDDLKAAAIFIIKEKPLLFRNCVTDPIDL
jgi:glutamine cyclotransferase